MTGVGVFKQRLLSDPPDIAGGLRLYYFLFFICPHDRILLVLGTTSTIGTRYGTMVPMVRILQKRYHGARTAAEQGIRRMFDCYEQISVKDCALLEAHYCSCIDVAPPVYIRC